MTLTSFDFFFFLFVMLILYYMTGKRFQKYVLLFASVYFYLQAVTIDTAKVVLILLYVIGVTWLGAILIERCKGKVKTAVVFCAVSALIAILFVLKYAYNMAVMLLDLLRVNGDVSFLEFASLMGISYFTLAAIGYLVDVYWETYKAEKNIFMVSLFITYFPQTVSGPVTRFGQMREQFEAHHKLEYHNIAYGMRRMAWGYFKKLVLSERFAVVVSTIYGSYTECSGMQLAFATLCYVLRLYTDFSGCMDIVLGASQLFGIVLPENFNGPFLSKTIQEFWQRWHISLGTWFKDYVMYPVQISKPMVALGKRCKKRFGKKVGKKIPMYASMFVLWFLIGVWHGATAYYFVASALVPYVLLIGSELLQPVFSRMKETLKVNTECFGFRLFQRIRTNLLLGICWVFVCAGSVGEGVLVLKQIFTRFLASGVPGTTLAMFDFTVSDVVLMLLGVALLIFEHWCVVKKTTMAQAIDKQNAVLKYVVIYAELLLILFYGMVGNSTFIYFNF